MKNWMNKNKKLLWLIVGVVGVVIGIFGLTYWIFTSWKSIPAGENLEKSDWLAFWGTFLSFSGALILGIVAVYQNIKQREDNEKSENKIVELTKQANELSKRQMMINNMPKCVFGNNGWIKFQKSSPSSTYLDDIIEIELFEKETKHNDKISILTECQKVNDAIISQIELSNAKIICENQFDLEMQCGERYEYSIVNKDNKKIMLTFHIQNLYNVITKNENISDKERMYGNFQIEFELKLKNIYGDTSSTLITMQVVWEMFLEEYDELYNKTLNARLKVIYGKEKIEWIN